jgi:hypothetical protein
MQAFRYCWGSFRNVRCNFQWDIITHTSFVVVTASEGRESVEDGVILQRTDSPQRFIGAARFSVNSIAPHDGGVTFQVSIDWDEPLLLWTDIIVFDGISAGYGVARSNR